MHTQKIFPLALIRCLAVASMALLLAAGTGLAQTGPANYALLVGAGFLCDLGDSSACPAVVKSADGSSYELTGVGTLNTQSKSVTATGTFTRKSPDGNTLETGIWVATDFVSFSFYGLAPGALLHSGMGLGPPQFGPRRMPMLGGPMAAGGLAVLRIRLLPLSGFPRNATLQVNCALGKVPDEHPTEGIRLSFEGRGAEFDQEVSGRALFLLNRFAAGAPAKAPAPDVETKPAPAEAQQ